MSWFSVSWVDEQPVSVLKDPENLYRVHSRPVVCQCIINIHHSAEACV